MNKTKKKNALFEKKTGFVDAFSRCVDRLEPGGMMRISRKMGRQDKWLSALRYNIMKGNRITSVHYQLLLRAFPSLQSVEPYPHVGRTLTGAAAKHAAEKKEAKVYRLVAVPKDPAAAQPTVTVPSGDAVVTALDRIAEKLDENNRLLQQLLDRWS